MSAFDGIRALASNVQVVEDDEHKRHCRIYCEWQCSVCHRIHWLVEHVKYEPSRTSGHGTVILDRIGPIATACGHVTVFMPWSSNDKAPQRDKESIYGQNLAEQRAKLYFPEKFGEPHFQMFYQQKDAERRLAWIPATSVRRRGGKSNE